MTDDELYRQWIDARVVVSGDPSDTYPLRQASRDFAAWSEQPPGPPDDAADGRLKDALIEGGATWDPRKRVLVGARSVDDRPAPADGDRPGRGRGRRERALEEARGKRRPARSVAAALLEGEPVAVPKAIRDAMRYRARSPQDMLEAAVELIALVDIAALPREYREEIVQEVSELLLGEG